ncbi:Dual specificity protein phosphatase 10 [Mortierella sp. GBA30]|nr:Dual specificity protein phosphatase 10 [Mortierella sp. GBA30]
MSPPAPMLRPTSHSFSLQRPLLAQDVRKTRNSKRLSLLVPPSPGKLESLAAAAAAASSPSLQPPSTPSASSSFSTRRHFTSAPLSTTLPTVPQSTTTTPTVDTTAERQSFLMLDQALPTSRLPMMGGSTASSSSSNSRRPISAYFSDFSVECGVASPYTSEPVCILPHLYLGAEHNALDVNTLSRMGITSVLNVAVEIATAASQEQRQQLQLQQQQATHSGRGLTATTTATTMGGSKFVYTPQGRIIHYKNLSWTHHQKNLQEEFPVAFKFIEETKGLGGKVLVHCQLGVSRSASLVIAYVMKTQQMGLSDAYEFVKTRSAVISPNMSLMYQLAEFEKSLSRVGHALSTSPEDEDDDIYPYPTDGMDIGREYEEGRVREKKRINSSNSDRLSDQTMTLTPAAAGGDYPPKRVADAISDDPTTLATLWVIVILTDDNNGSST